MKIFEANSFTQLLEKKKLMNFVKKTWEKPCKLKFKFDITRFVKVPRIWVFFFSFSNFFLFLIWER